MDKSKGYRFTLDSKGAKEEAVRQRATEFINKYIELCREYRMFIYISSNYGFRVGDLNEYCKSEDTNIFKIDKELRDNLDI
jgi:hypothetical protein